MSAAIRTKSTAFLRRVALPSFRNAVVASAFSGSRSISTSGVRCAAAPSGVSGRKASARLSHVQQLLLGSEEHVDESEPPKIRLEHVSVIVSNSGGGGGQRDNKVDPRVSLRFNVKKATWLSERFRIKILQLEKNRINKDGEIVVSSRRTLTQQGNIQHCLSKLQAILDAAAYVQPPPSEDQKKIIAHLAEVSELKRLQNQKAREQRKLI